MKILVTGGAGFIGSNFIRYMLQKYSDIKIVNYDKLTYAGNLENLKDIENDPRYKFVKGDICDKDAVEKVLQENEIDTVVHFAAESHVDRSILEPDAFIKTNIVGTFTLLEAAKKNGKIRFHHVSTDEVFGSLEPSDAPFNEKSPYDPRSPYSAAKASSDHLVRAYFHTYGLPITISNCSNNYGPFMFPEKLMPFFITNLIEEKKVPLYGDGTQVRDWLWVTDHCRAIDLILQRGKIGETYFVGGNCEKNNKEIADKILVLMGEGEDKIEYIKDRPGHDKRYAIDASRIEKELNWEPQMDFETGMKEMVLWYKENEDWWKKIKSGEYQAYFEKNYTQRGEILTAK